MTTGSSNLDTLLPSVYRCLNGVCKSHSFEYIVWNDTQENECPSCKNQGAHVRRILSKSAKCYTCGCCTRTIWLEGDEWPVGAMGWGTIQLNSRMEVKHICRGCQERMVERFPLLKENIPLALPQVEEVLPKIIQPSQMVIEEEEADESPEYHPSMDDVAID